MTWQEKFKDKIISPTEAALLIKSGDRIVSQQLHLSAEPVLSAICTRASELENVTFFSAKSFYDEPFLKEEYQNSFRFITHFLGASSRSAFYQNRASLVPIHYQQVPRWLREVYQPNVLILVISEPDENGISSFSVNVDYTAATLAICDMVIAQVNRYAPKTCGNEISLNQVDYIVEADFPLMEMMPREPDETALAIGSYIEPYITDGSCIQLGLGTIPNAICTLLHEKKDLGVHTELFSDGIVDLYHAGVITGRCKQIDQGKIVANTVCGSRKVFDFVNDNPSVLMRSVEYTNDPSIISQNNNMVSVNSCVEIDLLGQVVADTVAGRAYGGIGGQVDFVRGSQASRNGKSFIAMPSTAIKGTRSRIVCQLEKGTPVTTSRFDIQYVVTEYGCVNLWGMDTRQRAKALIGIAHPAFREVLRIEAERKGIL